MTTQTTGTQAAPTLAAFEQKIVGQIEDAEATIQTFEAKVKAKRLRTEIAAIDGLKTTRQILERKLQALSTTSTEQIAYAKVDIDATAAALKTALDEFARKLATLAAKE